MGIFRHAGFGGRVSIALVTLYLAAFLFMLAVRLTAFAAGDVQASLSTDSLNPRNETPRLNRNPLNGQRLASTLRTDLIHALAWLDDRYQTPALTLQAMSSGERKR